MLKMIEWIRPNGKSEVRLFSTPHESFFQENNIEVEYEYDNQGSVIFYVKMMDYCAAGEDPEELLEILPEGVNMIDALTQCKDLAEDYMKHVSIEEYLRND